MPSSGTAVASTTPREPPSRCARGLSRSRAAPKLHGNRPIDQAEAAARFIAAPEHEKMHDERLWDLRQKRDREMHGIDQRRNRSLASAIKEHTLTHLDEYLDQCPGRSPGTSSRTSRDVSLNASTKPYSAPDPVAEPVVEMSERAHAFSGRVGGTEVSAALGEIMPVSSFGACPRSRPDRRSRSGPSSPAP